MIDIELLPFDVVFYIAKQDYTAWIRLMLIDARLHVFARANPKQIIELFTDKSVANETRLFGNLHSFDDQPAEILTYGSRLWYVNGKLHRDNGLPAVILASGTQIWYVNGKQHRDNDLPAVIWIDGSQEWYVNGNHIR